MRTKNNRYARGRVTRTPALPVRRRRNAAEAEREILDAAEAFLRERPFRELTIDEMMSRTGLSRPSFYQYFRDRNQLVIRLVDKFSAELLPVRQAWYEATREPIESLRRGCDGVAAVWARHGPMLRAVADAATLDRKIDVAYRAFMGRIIADTAKRIRLDVAATRTRGLDPDVTAEALIVMSERYLTEKLGRIPQADPKDVAATLAQVWIRTLYGGEADGMR